MADRLRAEMFRALIARTGGFDAACAAIEAATGEAPHRSTVSQVQNGNAMVPGHWVEILENASGYFPFFNMRRRELEQRAEDGASSPLDLSSAAAKEGGEAISWGLKAIASGKAGDAARAAVEHREAADAHTRCANHFETQGTATVTPISGKATPLREVSR